MASAGNIFRSIIHGFLVFFLSATTFIGITLISLSLTVTDKETVKSWPAQAVVYDDITGKIVDLAAQEQGGGEDNELSQLLNSETLDTNAIKSSINDVYTAHYWQGKYSGLVDNVYDWLEGNQPDLQFEINFNDKTDELAGALSAEMANQLANLSTCQPNQIPRQFDILSAECLPPGVTATQAANQFERGLSASDGPLNQDLRLSSDELDLSAETKVNLQRAYGTASALPLIITATILVLISLVTVTGRTWLYGLRRAGLTLLSAGILSWIGFFLLKQLGNFTPRVDDEATQQIVEDVMAPLLQAVIDSVAGIGLWVSLTALITGALLWLGAYIWHKVHHHSEAEKIAKRSMTGRTAGQPSQTLPEPVDPSSKNESH